MNLKLDAISTEIFWSRLVSIVDEVAVALLRTSFSNVVRDAEDFSVAMFDAAGNLLAQGTSSIPSHLGAMPNVVKHFLDRFPPQTLVPGDAIITNDPWIGNGHLEDVFLATPVFHHGKLAAFSLNIVHHCDIGGRYGTSESREIFEEGLRIPISKLCKAGEPNEDIFNIIAANVRTPDKVIGDINAQLAANHVGSTRLLEFLEEQGWENMDHLAREIFDRTEAAMRASIEELPDGTYRQEFIGEEAGTSGRPITIKVAVTIKGSDIHVDYTGTSPQEDKAINVALNYTYAHTVFGLKAAINPVILNNTGSLRCFRVTAPEGCILNPRFPAALFWRIPIGHMLPEMVFHTLQPVIPERVMAGNGSTPLSTIAFNGEEVGGRRFVDIVFFNGGMGGRSDRDGVSCLAYPANISNSSLEILENEAPLLFEKKELICDSGGAGRFRGGCGQEIVMRVPTEGESTARTVAAFVAGGRFERPAQGLQGGKEGSCSRIVLNGDHVYDTSQEFLLKPGDVVSMLVSGGGGYGSPLEREPRLVAEDVRNGMVSLRKAGEDYGVVLDESTLEVDEEATKAARAARDGGIS